MHQRKKKMYDLSDAFIILPGGIGTLEEFSEITTWKILGIEKKPIFLLNFDGFYDHIIQQFEVMEKYNCKINTAISLTANIEELKVLAVDDNPEVLDKLWEELKAIGLKNDNWLGYSSNVS